MPMDVYRPERTRYQSTPARMTPTTTIEETLGVKYGYTMKSSPMAAWGQRDALFPYKNKPKPIAPVSNDRKSQAGSRFIARQRSSHV
jgi:hypothetical protein